MRAKRRYTVILAQFTKGFERLEEAEAFLGGGKCRNHCCGKQSERISLPGTKGSTEHGSTRSFFLGLGTPDSGGKTMRRPGIRRCRQERRRICGWKLSACARKVLLRCGPLPGGKELNLAEEYSDPDLVSMRNVGRRDQGRRAGHGLLPDT